MKEVQTTPKRGPCHQVACLQLFILLIDLKIQQSISTHKLLFLISLVDLQKCREV